ncbi:MAG: anthranilate phosphoribosyltransferase [bacterium]
MKELLEKCLAGEHLTSSEASSALEMMMDGNASDALIAGLLIALRVKGETIDEVTGFARTMRERSVHISVNDPDAIDMCGTGGDGAGTFNVSTIASLVAAGAGVTIAKHGNKAVSSTCGSADILSALGVRIDLSPSQVEECVNTIGYGFMLAPLFHPAMKHVAKLRRELGVRTVFNMLGPITNPAGVRKQVIGTFSSSAARTLAGTLNALEAQHSFVVHGRAGIDEVTLTGETEVHEVKANFPISIREVDASAFALPEYPLSSLRGDGVEGNLRIAIDVLDGKEGAARDVVIANAALGIQVSGKGRNLTEAVSMARESLDSGSAREVLNQLISFSNAR